MSKVRDTWAQLGEAQLESKTGQRGSLELFYENYFGRFFSNGLNIGREVNEKLNAKKFNEVWPTLLQAEGLDSGLTAGFLTACGICTIEEDENPLRHLPEIMRKNYGVIVEFEHIATEADLERYPQYADYPNQQQWSLPGVMIHYDTSPAEPR